jgi:hypothetical protein
MNRAHLLLAVAAVLASTGCKQEEDRRPPIALEVECIGLSQDIPLAGYYQLQHFPSYRCEVLLSDTVFEKEVAVLGSGSDGRFGQPNTLLMQINFGEKTWHATSGKVYLDANDGGKAAGRFEVEASSGAETAIIKGPIDWCDYGRRRDCPYVSAGGLTKHVGFEPPEGYSVDESATFASDCRVLYEPATGAMQVDLDVAVHNGRSVAYWKHACSKNNQPPPNHFRFRSGGVTGPGSYGPFQVVKVEGGGNLPDFELSMPIVYWGNTDGCLTRYNDSVTVTPHPIEPTVCSFIVQDSPGRFELSCSKAFRSETGLERTGDFTLRADCDVRTR